MRYAMATCMMMLPVTCFAQTSRPTTRPGDFVVPLTISGGHETDRRDGGRPVILVASALGVPEQVFRDAFKNVHPARGGGGPTQEQARENKKVLMDALAKYGVTNDRLDGVSNRYRYPPGSDSLWTNRSAKGTATIRDGQVVGVTFTDAGNGYTSLPTISVEGYPDVKITPALSFGKEFDTNGSIASAALSD